MNVLSLFDGMSCGQIALERCGFKVDNYFASEIHKPAIKVAKHNYPGMVHIGDVTKIKYENGKLFNDAGDVVFEGKIDLLIGGSPCQDFSSARAMASRDVDGLDGSKSVLFYQYLRLLKETTPEYWLLENVKMKKESKTQLDNYLGVEGVEINSKLVSYQSRRRLYWSNIPFDVPEDRDISFQTYKETDVDVERLYKLNRTPSREKMWNNGEGKGTPSTGCMNVTNKDKICCLTTKQDRNPNSGLVAFEDFARYLTRGELEQAQTVPLGYTDVVSYNQAAAMLGNGWTVDVICHILKNIRMRENK